MRSEEEAGRNRFLTRYQEHLGIELVSAAAGSCTMRLPFKDELGNRRGHIHGGALASLADIGLSRAIRSQIEGEVSLATIQLQMTYLEAAEGSIDCHAKALKIGGAVAMAEAELVDHEGRLCAKASGSFRVLRR